MSVCAAYKRFSPSSLPPVDSTVVVGLNSNTPHLMLLLWPRQMPRFHDASADIEAIALDRVAPGYYEY